MNKADKGNLIDVIEIRKKRIRVSHLQYADDMIFIGKASNKNAWAMWCILKNFELLLGLKVNYNKCSLIRVNVELQDMASVLGCMIGEILFSYL